MNRHVLVTGASRGIGRSCALALARAGFDLVLWARRGGQLDEVAALCAPLGVDVQVAAVDVRSAESVRGDGTRSLQRLEGLRGVVLNAGAGEWRPFAEVTESDWDDTIDTNLGGAYRSLQVALPHLYKHPDAQAVAIGSDSSRYPFAQRAAYCASKWGLRGMLESVRLEVRERGVRCTHLMVSRVDTYFRNSKPGDRRDALRADDVGQLVAWLFGVPAHCELRELEVSALAERFGPYGPPSPTDLRREEP